MRIRAIELRPQLRRMDQKPLCGNDANDSKLDAGLSPSGFHLVVVSVPEPFASGTHDTAPLSAPGMRPLPGGLQ